MEPKNVIAKVKTASRVEFTLHDLRRTFITAAERLDLGIYAIKRLVNHSLSGDVTAGYIITDVERLREPMQRITDFLVSAGELHTKSNVIAFPSPKSRKELADV